MRIGWLLPPLIEGSGGHRTILEQAKALEAQGHECFIYVEGPQQTSDALRKKIRQHFQVEFTHIISGWQHFQPADAFFATVWYSAKIVRDIPLNCKKFYFIQDYEASFHAMGDAYLAAENSYRYDLIPITIGRYLTHRLNQSFNQNAYYFDFGANHTIYHKEKTQKPGKQSICFIYQPEKPRRCPQLGLEALGIAKHLRPDLSIYLYGSKVKKAGHIWFDHTHLGLLTPSQCNDLYNQCHIGLCLSASNPSRIPFEMMASGLPVVELYKENTLYDFPDAAVSLADATPESIAKAIIAMTDNLEKQQAMSQQATHFMQQRTAESEKNQFVDLVESLMAGNTIQQPDIVPCYQKPMVMNYSDADHITPLNPSSLSRRQQIRQKIPNFLQPLAYYLYCKIRRYLL